MITIDLTTTGARSGNLRRVQLYAIADGENLAIVGSWAGRPRHPAWVHNLRAAGHAKVKRGRREYEVRAREVEGAERERLWKALCAGFPLYARYQDRTQRRFAVFVLEPAGIDGV